MAQRILGSAPNGLESMTDAASLESFPDYPACELPSELITGHRAIDAEHYQLMVGMANLRTVCSFQLRAPDCKACEEARRGACENSLVALLGDLLSFVIEHFRNEEQIMRDSLLLMIERDLCEAHMEDHAAISSKVQQIVASLDPLRTVVLIRELDTLLTRWISNHIIMHDQLLVRWVEREDSVLKQDRRLSLG